MTRATSIIALATLLLLPALAASAASAEEVPTSCEFVRYGQPWYDLHPLVVTEPLTCVFRCEAGGALLAAASGTSIHVTAECGGAGASAGGLLPGLMTIAGAGPIPAHDVGTCTLAPAVTVGVPGAWHTQSLPAALAYEAWCEG